MFSNFFGDEVVLKRRVLVALSLLLTLCSLYLVAKTVNEFKLSSTIGGDIPVQNTISVDGEGEVLAVPDTATFSFTVNETASTVAQAQTTAAKKIDAALAMLKKEGIADADIKTVDYSMYPKYDYGNTMCGQYGCPPVSNPKIIGYVATQSIEVKVHSLDKAPALLSGVGALGVSNVSGISFSVSTEKKSQEEARQKAIAEAKAKAVVLANDLGVSLGRVVNFSESGVYYPMKYAVGAMDSGRGGAVAPTVQVPAGENKITSQVHITYEIR